MIFFLKLVLKDLDEIWDYIEIELCSPSTTQNAIDGILDKVDELASFPESGAKLEFENGLDSGRDYMRILFPGS